jgi:pyruvate formate lyase activating enzyme
MGVIFDIQKFCIHDGPGIRTTVFLKGCPLRCAWCHNPESQRQAPELLYTGHSCIGCGACLSVCPNHAHEIKNGVHILDHALCRACGICAEVCPAQALSVAGKEISAEEILGEILRDKPFYDASGGGLTISGGEPCLQPDFTLALLKGAKENGLHTCIETCGFADTEKLLAIAAFTDLFLYDWKCTDDALHRTYTGVGNERILKNLRALDAVGARVILRCPIIPKVNNNEAHFDGIAALANSLKCISAVEIEPYHTLGTGKAEGLGVSASVFPTPTQADIDTWLAALRARTATPVRRS